MRCLVDTTWLWNTGQDKKTLLIFCYVLLSVHQVCARPDFLDTMSRQFFGISDNEEQIQQQNHQSNSDPFAQMFGSSNQQASQRPPPRNYQHPNQHHRNPPQRQGYYAPPHVVQQQHVPQQHVPQQHVPQQHVPQQHVHLPYNGPPPVYGTQQGFGQRQPNSNETKTEGFPSDTPRSHSVQHHPHQAQHPYTPTEFHPHQQPVAIGYQKPETVVEYQTHPQQVEYLHIPQQHAVQEHHGPTLEINTGTEHAYHEPPAHVEYHAPPEVEYHHHPTHKPKRFHFSFNEPSPHYRIIDKHLKLPPVKFRFHINPKIVITSNTKDPLDKKHHHDDEHDLEPYPPPDVFSDPNAPPQINKHIVEHYPVVEHHVVKHPYPVEHHVVNHPYPVEHHAIKHPYPVEHHAVKHPYPVEHHAANHHVIQYAEPKHSYPVEHHSTKHHPDFTYDLSHGHSHLNPHRSLGHYEPTFKIKTKPIIFTEPPPTPPTRAPTTTRSTTTTARTTTSRTTTTTRPTRRARISARNPGFSVAFTQSPTTANTTDVSTSSSTTTRRSIFRNNSERERENGGISARRDEVSTSAETSSTARSATTSTTTTTTSTTTTPTTTSSTTTTTTPKPSSTTMTTTTLKPTSTSTTTTTPKPTSSTATTTTTPIPTTASTTTTTTTTTEKPTTASARMSQTSQFMPAEETTPRTTTLNVGANEIDMRRATESPRRRPEPLVEDSSNVNRAGSFNLENSESVKVVETTMLIDGKNQTVRFYYITEPVKLPLDIFQRMTGQSKDSPSGLNVIKLRDKRYAVKSVSKQELENFSVL